MPREGSAFAPAASSYILHLVKGSVFLEAENNVRTLANRESPLCNEFEADTHPIVYSSCFDDSVQLQGLHSRLQPCPEEISDCLTHYWHKHTKDMILVHSVEKAAPNLSAAVSRIDCLQDCPTTWRPVTSMPYSFDVWYDPPLSPMACNFSAEEGESLLVFPGKVASASVQILIDSGASHNFVDAAFCQAHSLQIHKDPGTVTCGGNAIVSSLGYVHVPVQLQAYVETVKLIVMPVAEVAAFQVILGQQWLRQRGAKIDYDNECVVIQHRNSQVVLRCGPTIDQESVILSAAQFRRELLRKGAKLVVMAITDPSVAAESPQTAHPAGAQAILSEYADVFATIHPGLPPERNIGHTINTGDAPPVARPMYRMSPKEKECAEEMFKDLIEKVWIRPSNSPYSSYGTLLPKAYTLCAKA